jgi:hypothetical protein
LRALSFLLEGSFRRIFVRINAVAFCAIALRKIKTR